MTALQNICKLIRSGGPLSVAQYMREALTNPISGYYIHKNMLGEKGDFITSPEISQIFGELMGIWCISQWQELKCPTNLRIIEFGPGKGTMASDILRTMKCFPALMDQCNISMNFVEISHSLSRIQKQKLCPGEDSPQQETCTGTGEFYQCGWHHNVPLYWYKSLSHLNLEQTFQGCTIFLAYEFFDALPIHKFVNTDNAWKEVFVDVDDKEDRLKYVLHRNATIAAKTLINVNETRSHIEISPESNFIVREIGNYISQNDGACLIGDYGHFGTKEDTFRGFKSHKVTDPLENVGEADLTADVDFKQLLSSLNECNILKACPVTQQHFLRNMGIELRTKMLLSTCNDDTERSNIMEGYKTITSPEKMGEKFKFIAFRSYTQEHTNTITGFE